MQDGQQHEHVFGKPISQFQYWQFKFAEYATQLENARNLYVKAALTVDKGRPNVQTMCATGEQFPLEAIYRDSKIGEIYEGANEIQRLVIARGIFGKGNTG